MATAKSFTAIKQLIKSERVTLCKDGTLAVTETDRSASLKKILIDSVGANAFSIKYDECKFPCRETFSDTISLHKGCDSISFCEVGGIPYILFLELKSSEPVMDEVVCQFRSAHCFLAYLDTLLQKYYSLTSIADWQCYFFVFHRSKRMVAEKKPSRDIMNNTQPETAKFVNVDNSSKFYLRELLGKPC